MTNNRTTELLPCPFCGGEAYVHAHYSFPGHERKGEYPNYEPIGYAVGCRTLDCRGKRENTGFLYDTEAEAIAAWNTRAELGSTCPFARPTDLTDGCAALERIAELEAELGSGTCEMVTSGTACKGNTDKRCTACGAYGIGEHYDGDEHIVTPKFCQECWRKVVSE